MENLTIQAFIDHQWQDVALLTFPKSAEGNYRLVTLEYLGDHTLEHLNKDDIHAVSINYPLAFFFDDKPDWLTFLDDIIPAGASRRYWVALLDIADLTTNEQNYILLKFGTISPVGHLRIKESVEALALQKTLSTKNLQSHYFSLEDVKNRAGDFLDYAQQRGAIAGGATGAGGEAPKLLLRCNMDDRASPKIWIDPYQNDLQNPDHHYLVKYPRGARSEVDCNILRAEYHYYHELEAMGFDTIPTEDMRLEEGINYPTLWLPRFDIQRNQEGVIERVAMESVYSMLGKGAGASLEHGATIRAIIHKINQSHMVQAQGFEFDVEAFVIEWVKRDLLNIIFGNSDNHGRNTTFLRVNAGIKLAPIYDFAPMKADPEGIPRTMKWESAFELGGNYNFIAIAQSLADLVPSDRLLNELKHTANQCLNLKQRLIERGVPTQIIEMPAIGLNYIEQRITQWGLKGD